MPPSSPTNTAATALELTAENVIALERYLAATDEEVPDVLAEFTTALLGADCLHGLEERLAAEADTAQKEKLQQRHTLLVALNQLADLPHDEMAFLTFMNVKSHAAMVEFALEENEADLDDLERTAAAHLAVASGDEAAAIRQRLDALRRIRAEELPAARAQAEDVAQMSDAERLLLAFERAAGPADIMGLVGRTPDDDLDGLEQAAQARSAAASGDDETVGWQRRLNDLRAWRATEQEARHALAPLTDEESQALANRLIAWIQTPNWDASQEFIADHTAELLSGQGAAALTLLRMVNPGNSNIELHVNLLAACQRVGIARAYTQLHQQMATAQTMQDSPQLQAVAAFVQADDETAARLLAQPSSLLLTADARNLLEQFLAAAQQQGDPTPQQHIAARLAQWQTAWAQHVGGPLRRAAAERQPEAWGGHTQDQQRQPAVADRSVTYHIVTANHCAIGENNTVLNIYSVGELPLAWSRPQETRPDLAALAVGRAVELDDLHRRLEKGDAALVGVRGLAGVGKTVLAAMYATTCASRYPGGVIWVNVGPRVRSRDDVTPLLKRLAAYAYSRDLRVAWLDEIVFTPNAVQMLLGGHDRLLLVFDDVWSQEAAVALKAVAPPGSAVLLTTRDRRVAYAVGGPEAIQELDVLSKGDARALLQRRAPGLMDDLADTVAAGLGCHAQALALAGAALFLRRPHHYAQTAKELGERVARGAGFGDLPALDETDAETNVEIALKYTYDYLGEDLRNGSQRQACLRSLGTFAQEASFDAAAAASLWQMPGAAAEELLLLFDHLALIQEAKSGERWQQHAILRAYALSLQDENERLSLPQRHADYYLELARASIPSATDRVELEFMQLEHAFDWCQQHSPRRATHLANTVSQVMFIRGRAAQAGEWLRASIDATNQTGDRAGKANTLKSLGDLESRLGNIDAALPLYEAEQDPVGKMNVYIGVARMEAALGNVELADEYYHHVFTQAEAIGFADHPVTLDLRREYEDFRRMASVENDPLAAALSALLRVDSDPALAQALADHPILAEADALFALVAMLDQALRAQQNESIIRLMVLLAVLLERYNKAHMEPINLERQLAVIDQCNQLIPLAEQIDAGLAAAVRQQAGWACNMLGNHYADVDKNQAAAVDAYTRGLTFDANNAVLLRNRAGARIELDDLAAAQADIDAAANLEPDAPRLTELRRAWAARAA